MWSCRELACLFLSCGLVENWTRLFCYVCIGMPFMLRQASTLLTFVILNEVIRSIQSNDLTRPTGKILRCAQDDRQGSGSREQETGNLVCIGGWGCTIIRAFIIIPGGLL